MIGKDLLTLIWSGDITVCGADARSPLAALLDGILTVPTVSLVAKSGVGRPMAFADSTELLPGVQLGDVLEEELGFDVPVNCVILVEAADAAAAGEVSPAELGRDLGRVLTAVAGPALQPGETPAPVLQSDMPKQARGRATVALAVS